MLKIILKFWPAFTPVLIFTIWYLFTTFKNKDIKVYDEFLEKKKRYMYFTLIVSCIIIIAMAIYLALSEPATDREAITHDMVLKSSE